MVVLLEITACTSSRMTGIIFLHFVFYSVSYTFYIKWVYCWCRMVVLPVFAACTSSWMTRIFYFYIWFFYSLSCNFYIKWVYFSCRMVVLLTVKYWTSSWMMGLFNFFLNLDSVCFLVLSIISACDGHVKWLYFQFYSFFKIEFVYISTKVQISTSRRGLCTSASQNM
jgi:hypothetical protein